jgi:hypothetical protein
MKRQLTISLLVLAVLLLAAPIAAVKTGRRIKRAATVRPFFLAVTRKSPRLQALSQSQPD